MTSSERQIILKTLEERRKLVEHYYDEGKCTGNWENHKECCKILDAVTALSQSLLGVNKT